MKFILSEGIDKTDGFYPLCDIGSPLRADKNRKDASSKHFCLR